MRFYKKLLIFSGMMLLTVGGVEASTLKVVLNQGTTLVPLRTISEELGAKVNYDAATQHISIDYGKQHIDMKAGNQSAEVNGQECQLQLAPRIINSTTYVPIRFIGEALGGRVDYKNSELEITLDEITKKWTLEFMQDKEPEIARGKTFQRIKQTINGKSITGVKIDMNDSKVKVKIATAGDKVTQAAPLKTMAQGATVAVNGTYFAAYNGAIPLPDGTLVKEAKVLHISDIGSTIGFTSDQEVLIDFVKTRVQGYVNGEVAWKSYRVNRDTPDSSAVILYTPEYQNEIQLTQGRIGVVCVNGKIIKHAMGSVRVPNDGFVLVISSGKVDSYNIGDSISYKAVYEPQNTAASDWEKVTYALGAGPSLKVNGKTTGSPKDESFTDPKVLTQSAQRTFIGVTANNEVIIGTTSATIQQLKEIVNQLGLVSAMCLDGGASSGLYYNGEYLTSPGRNINNCINFYYQ